MRQRERGTREQQRCQAPLLVRFGRSSERRCDRPPTGAHSAHAPGRGNGGGDETPGHGVFENSSAQRLPRNRSPTNISESTRNYSFVKCRSDVLPPGQLIIAREKGTVRNQDYLNILAQQGNTVELFGRMLSRCYHSCCMPFFFLGCICSDAGSRRRQRFGPSTADAVPAWPAIPTPAKFGPISSNVGRIGSEVGPKLARIRPTTGDAEQIAPESVCIPRFCAGFVPEPVLASPGLAEVGFRMEWVSDRSWWTFAASATSWRWVVPHPRTSFDSVTLLRHLRCGVRVQDVRTRTGVEPPSQDFLQVPQMCQTPALRMYVQGKGARSTPCGQRALATEGSANIATVTPAFGGAGAVRPRGGTSVDRRSSPSSSVVAGRPSAIVGRSFHWPSLLTSGRCRPTSWIDLLERFWELTSRCLHKGTTRTTMRLA